MDDVVHNDTSVEEDDNKYSPSLLAANNILLVPTLTKKSLSMNMKEQ